MDDEHDTSSVPRRFSAPPWFETDPTTATVTPGSSTATGDGRADVAARDVGDRAAQLAERPETRLLVVDDEPATLRLYERLLGGAGYRCVETTASPLEFIRRFGDEPPSLAIVDLEMPALDGIALLGHLRPDRGDADPVPLLATASGDDVEQRGRALRAGAHVVLTKPLDLSIVLLTVRNLLRLGAHAGR